MLQMVGKLRRRSDRRRRSAFFSKDFLCSAAADKEALHILAEDRVLAERKLAADTAWEAHIPAEDKELELRKLAVGMA